MSIVANYDVAVAVTKSDSTVLGCRGFYVGGTGDVAIMPREGGTAVTLKGCLAGVIYPIAAYNIMATNTTATDIVALT